MFLNAAGMILRNLKNTKANPAQAQYEDREMLSLAPNIKSITR
jgi:hypothetical protein